MRTNTASAGHTALVCDPSFGDMDSNTSARVFPQELLDSLSEKFTFSVLGQLDMMPIVFIKASSNQLDAMDAYLEENYGDAVSVEGSAFIQTDIKVSPT